MDPARDDLAGPALTRSPDLSLDVVRDRVCWPVRLRLHPPALSGEIDLAATGRRPVTGTVRGFLVVEDGSTASPSLPGLVQGAYGVARAALSGPGTPSPFGAEVTLKFDGARLVLAFWPGAQLRARAVGLGARTAVRDYSRLREWVEAYVRSVGRLLRPPATLLAADPDAAPSAVACLEVAWAWLLFDHRRNAEQAATTAAARLREVPPAAPGSYQHRLAARLADWLAEVGNTELATALHVELR